MSAIFALFVCPLQSGCVEDVGLVIVVMLLSSLTLLLVVLSKLFDDSTSCMFLTPLLLSLLSTEIEIVIYLRLPIANIWKYKKLHGTIIKRLNEMESAT